MNVIEIFSSIEGEGTRQGYLCTFVRLYGCNLRCSYCDTPYSYEGGDYQAIDVKDVAETVRAIGNKYVTITGGEPLLQEQQVIELIALLGKDYEFNIETNGTIIPSFHRDNVWFTYDYKTPSSLAEESMNLDIFKVSTRQDLIKFVVGSVEDLDCMRRIINEYTTKAQIYVSPVWGKIEAASIIDYMKTYNLQNVRFQLQIHKFVWDPDAKGV